MAAQHVAMSNLKKAYNTYRKIVNYHAKMVANEQRHGALFNAGRAVAELHRLEQANAEVTQNLANRYGITQAQVYTNLMRVYRRFNNQRKIAKNAARAGSHRMAKKAFQESGITRQLAEMTWNPERRLNRLLRRPYAKSVSPVRSSKTRTPRRATSAPRNRSPPKALSPRRRQLTTAIVKRVIENNIPPLPSNFKKARRA